MVEAGYRKKPNWILPFAACMIAAPIMSFAFSAVLHKVPPARFATWARIMPVSVWVTCAAVVAAGIALLYVRKWTWQIAVGTLAVVVVYDVTRYAGASTLVNIVGTAAVTAAALIALCTPAFRRPYVDARSRWWETKPRFLANLPITVEAQPATLVDISSTGALIRVTEGGTSPAISDNITFTLPGDVRVQGKVARHSKLGFGVQLEALGAAEIARLNALLKTLAAEPGRQYR